MFGHGIIILESIGKHPNLIPAKKVQQNFQVFFQCVTPTLSSAPPGGGTVPMPANRPHLNIYPASAKYVAEDYARSQRMKGISDDDQ